MRKLGLCSAIALALLGCHEEASMLKAVQVTRMDQLIGGPSAKGKLGDFLIENDRIRVIIGGPGPGGAAGVFGGSLLDADLQRQFADETYGQGYDAFSEIFPLANLLVPNPAADGWSLSFDEEGHPRQGTKVSDVRVLKDGSDGEAVVRVTGHTGYMFHALKFLNRDFIDSFLESFVGQKLGPIEISSLDQLRSAVKTILGVNLDQILNRLQIDFNFTVDYILREGEDHLVIETTVESTPPSERRLSHCPQLDCNLECPHGLAMEERSILYEGARKGTPTICPICECAEGGEDEIPLFTESKDFLGLIVGNLQKWKDPQWKGGVVLGDFLYFGTESRIFMPGIGYDYDKKIFENQWQSVSTMTSPLVTDWIAGTANAVSYAITTVNPHAREGNDCETHRIAITAIEESAEDDLIAALTDTYGLNRKQAEIAARAVYVDRRPITLKTFETAVPEGTRYEDYLAHPEALPEYEEIAASLPEGVTLEVLPQEDCRPSKLLIPLIASAATAGLTHYNADATMTQGDDNVYVDQKRVLKARQYLTIGSGDVSSAVKRVYDLRKTPYGRIKGVVLEEDSLLPVQHADVFVLKDPRKDKKKDPLPKSYEEYEAQAQARFGSSGFVMQFETDLGIDPVVDGDYSGVVETGDYLVVAHHPDRGYSEFLPATVTKGSETILHFALKKSAPIEFRIYDEQGDALPAMLSFVAVDDKGNELGDDARNVVAMGDARYAHGVARLEYTVDGEATVNVPPGRYNIYISRGFEYALQKITGYEAVAGKSRPIEVVLPHEVETSHHISGDFHVHSMASTDSAIKPDKRLKAAIAQGLEFLSAADHDHMQYYGKYVKEMGLERWIGTQEGVEVSSLEFGHFNGYPLKYDATFGSSLGDAPPWAGSVLYKIFEGLYKRNDIKEENFVLQLNHPRDGWLGSMSQIQMRPWDLERGTLGIEMCNDAIQRMPCNFRAYEVMNGKHLEFLWSPTVREMDEYMDCQKDIVAARSLEDFGPEGFVCEDWRRQDEINDDCVRAEDELKAAYEAYRSNKDDAAAEAQMNAAAMARDHCLWHKALRQDFAEYCKEGTRLVDCKRMAMVAVKEFSVRYMFERTEDEMTAFAAMKPHLQAHPEVSPKCNLEKAMVGCEALPQGDGFKVGCGGADCTCEACVCAAHPECCTSAEEGGTGWNDECAGYCGSECGGCGNQPCGGMTQAMDDIFALWNRGVNVTAMANSDSHNDADHAGLPRTYVEMASDRVDIATRDELDGNIVKGKTVLSEGAYIEFNLEANGRVGEIGNRGSEALDARGAKTIKAHVKVQTPSWYRVERIEIYRNGKQEKLIFVDPLESHPERIVDFDQVIELPLPEEDSWYVVVAHSMNDRDPMAPIYKRPAFGLLLTSEVVASAAETLISNFADVMDLPLVKMALGDTDPSKLLSTPTLPNTFGPFVWGMTNPIWVDVDGDGFKAPDFFDRDGDGVADMGFCSNACSTNEDCGLNQICGDDGYCMLPIREGCVGTQPVAGVE